MTAAKRKPKKEKKPKNPPPVKVITYREYLEMLKGRFIPEG